MIVLGMTRADKNTITQETFYMMKTTITNNEIQYKNKKT